MSLRLIFPQSILVMEVELQGEENHGEGDESQISNNFVLSHFSCFLAVKLILSSANSDTGQAENLHGK